MAKHKFEAKVLCVGVFDGWEEKTKHLPKIKQYTNHLIAEEEREFGLIVNIQKAKGKQIHWCIEHPGIPDDQTGQILPPFEGSEYVKDNNWSFYLGDSIWAPIDNKGGLWRMTIELEQQLIVDEVFDVEVDEYNVIHDDSFRTGVRRKR